MAVNAVVLCNPLCFLVNKFGRTAAKPLKSMILDFYDVGVLCDSKSQLVCELATGIFREVFKIAQFCLFFRRSVLSEHTSVITFDTLFIVAVNGVACADVPSRN